MSDEGNETSALSVVRPLHF